MEKLYFFLFNDNKLQIMTTRDTRIPSYPHESGKKGGFMDSYEINKDTCAVISVSDKITKVIEEDEEYFINKSSYEVMEDSCQYYGSSCDGRIKGTKMILGSNYKVPIVVEESNEIIFFPTESPSSNNCTWISLNNVRKYEKSNGYTRVVFNSGREILLKMSVSSFETQILRANRLGSMIRKRIGK